MGTPRKQQDFGISTTQLVVFYPYTRHTGQGGQIMRSMEPISPSWGTPQEYYKRGEAKRQRIERRQFQGRRILEITGSVEDAVDAIPDGWVPAYMHCETGRYVSEGQYGRWTIVAVLQVVL